MRIEDTADLCDLVERSISQQIPAAEIHNVIDNIGLPYSGINLSYSNSAPVGTSDADILVTLNANHHPTDNYIHQLRLTLPKKFPGVTFAFLPADMVGQILNFGLPAPLDVQVVGNNLEGNRLYADALLEKLAFTVRAASLVTVLAGLLVLASAIAAGLRARLYDSTVMKVVGATRLQIARIYALEYALIGALTGTLALGAGATAATLVARRVFDLAPVIDWGTIVLIVGGGAALTLAFGLLITWTALAAKPAEQLRNL